jgi:hypothetical protein
MIKLKQVIVQLEANSYQKIEESFKKTKADNFALLFQSYRTSSISDKEIIEQLDITPNSFYVLKSRLYDKIQEFMAVDVFTNQENLIKQLLQVPEVCFSGPRETAIAFLHKLEKELLKFDLHNDLIVVYSALKKMHLHSDKYFLYSQLFNKHTALGLSLEKAEEILGNFNRVLGQYDFSGNEKLLDTLHFLKKEILNLYSLNASRQIEIIKNIIDLELIIFCKQSNLSDFNTEDILSGTRRLLSELPENAVQKKWELVLDYFCFEYYVSKNEHKAALAFYERVNENVATLLLYNNICLGSKFLTSKIRFCDELNRIDDFADSETSNPILYDLDDFHAKVQIKLYQSLIAFKQKKMKEAISLLNETLNSLSFKDYFQELVNIKLTLGYFYLTMKEYDLVEITIKSVARKIRSEFPDQYSHVLHLIKAFDNEMSQNGSAKILAKNKDLFTLFLANNKDHEIVGHLIPELKKKYQS